MLFLHASVLTGLGDEIFAATRRDVAKGTPWQEALPALQHDEVVIFELG